MNERDKKKKKIVLEGRKYMSLHANGIIKKIRPPVKPMIQKITGYRWPSRSINNNQV